MHAACRKTIRDSWRFTESAQTTVVKLYRCTCSSVTFLGTYAMRYMILFCFNTCKVGNSNFIQYSRNVYKASNTFFQITSVRNSKIISQTLNPVACMHFVKVLFSVFVDFKSYIGKLRLLLSEVLLTCLVLVFYLY